MQTTSTSSESQDFHTFANKHRAVMAGGGRRGMGFMPGHPPASVSYLEQKQNPVTSRVIACKCGCKYRFCENCCKKLGIDLKQRLKSVLQTFESVMMLTFTLDPEHFASPQEAFEYVKRHRCISVTMQALRRAGVLLSDRWLAVIEWQGNTMPHWHVLVEAKHIPMQTLKDAWNVNLRQLGKVAAETRTGFGSVKFSCSKFRDAQHAAGYACSYLTKHPKDGYPEWVLDSETRKVHRYSTSRGFWANSQDKPDIDESTEASEHEEGDDIEQESVESEPKPRRTIREQLSTCGQSTVILRETEEIDTFTGELRRRYDFLGKVDEPLESLLERVEHKDVHKSGKSAELTGSLKWLNDLGIEKCQQYAASELDELVHWWGWR